MDVDIAPPLRTRPQQQQQQSSQPDNISNGNAFRIAENLKRTSASVSLGTYRDMYMVLHGLSALIYSIDSFSGCELSIFGQSYYEYGRREYKSDYPVRPADLPISAVIRARLLQSAERQPVGIPFRPVGLVTYLHTHNATAAAAEPGRGGDDDDTNDIINPLALELHTELLAKTSLLTELQYRPVFALRTAILIAMKKHVANLSASVAAGVDLKTMLATSGVVDFAVEEITKMHVRLTRQYATFNLEQTFPDIAADRKQCRWFTALDILVRNLKNMTAAWWNRFVGAGGIEKFLRQPTVDDFMTNLGLVLESLYDYLAAEEAFAVLFAVLRVYGGGRTLMGDIMVLCGHRAAALIGTAMQAVQSPSIVNTIRITAMSPGSSTHDRHSVMLNFMLNNDLFLFSSTMGIYAFDHTQNVLPSVLSLAKQFQSPDYIVEMPSNYVDHPSAPEIAHLLRRTPLLSAITAHKPASPKFFVHTIDTDALVFCVPSKMLYIKLHGNSPTVETVARSMGQIPPSLVADMKTAYELLCAAKH